MSAPVEVRPFDVRDHAEVVHRIQQAAYLLEAALLGVASLPPLADTPATLRDCGEEFVGAFAGADLLGLVSYRCAPDGGGAVVLDVHRLAVHPGHYRRGIASALVRAVLGIAGVDRWIVSTGAANAPALALYRRSGFVPVADVEVEPGLVVTRLERPAPTCTATGAEHRVEPAGPEDLDALADLLADAFGGYPWTDWLVPADDRPRRLRALQRSDLELVGLPYGTVWVSRCPGSGRAVGALAVLRPDRPVPAEAWAAVARAEVEHLGEVGDRVRAAEALTGPWRPDGPAVVVATAGVLPDHRRRGLARRLVQEAADLADRLGVPAHLETSTEANVALYAGAGFVVTGSGVVPGGPPVWAMRREPRSGRQGRPVADR